jgi:hypothetical protein
VVDDIAKVRYPAIFVAEDPDSGNATLCLFTPIGVTYAYHIPAQQHAFQDEDGNYPFPYYITEETVVPESSTNMPSNTETEEEAKY